VADTKEQIAYDQELASLNQMKGIPSLKVAYDAALAAFNKKYPNNRPGTSSSTGAKAASSKGLTQALIDSRPDDVNLRLAWEAFLADNLTDAERYWRSSKYFTEVSDLSQSRGETKLGRPGVYTQDLAKYRAAQRVRLAQSGITLSEALFNTVTEDAYLGGLSDQELDVKALAAFQGKIGGNTLSQVNSLKSYANSFGMQYDQNTFDTYSRDIFAGLTTVADVQEKIRMDAASTYPVYKDQIDKGVSLDALASAYKSSMANILEKDPDSIGYNDPILRRALQYIGPDGKPSVKPLWQFEKELRSTPEWEYTNNARDTIDSLSLKVLRDWGLA
jgi:hypothetical protein